MKTLSVITLLLLSLLDLQAQWEIVRAEAKPLEKQTSAVSEDFWLHVVIRNATEKTLYVQGMGQWYMIEAFIKNSSDAVWNRQNTGVDRELTMVPVAPGEEIVSVRREAVLNIGKSMMLTFQMAFSQHEEIGSRVLLGEFKIPELPKTEPVAGINSVTSLRDSTP